LSRAGIDILFLHADDVAGMDPTILQVRFLQIWLCAGVKRSFWLQNVTVDVTGWLTRFINARNALVASSAPDYVVALLDNRNLNTPSDAVAFVQVMKVACGCWYAPRQHVCGVLMRVCVNDDDL
jgi:hypothetical protein